MRVDMGEQVMRMYERIRDKGWGQKDFSVIYQLMLEEAQQTHDTAAADASTHSDTHP